MNTLQIHKYKHRNIQVQMIQICRWLFSAVTYRWTLLACTSYSQIWYKYKWYIYKYAADCLHPQDTHSTQIHIVYKLCNTVHLWVMLEISKIPYTFYTFSSFCEIYFFNWILLQSNLVGLPLFCCCKSSLCLKWFSRWMFKCVSGIGEKQFP